MTHRVPFQEDLQFDYPIRTIIYQLNNIMICTSSDEIGYISRRHIALINISKHHHKKASQKNISDFFSFYKSMPPQYIFLDISK